MSDFFALRFTEEYLVFEEDAAKQLIEQMKKESGSGNYEVISHSTNKKIKKTVEYYVVKIIKEYNKQKDLIVE